MTNSLLQRIHQGWLCLLVILIITLTIVIRNHNHNTLENNASKIVKEYIGTTIELPDSFNVISLGGQTKIQQTQARFKILTIIDSLGCTSCKMQLSHWDNYISHLQNLAIDPEDIELIYIIEKRIDKTILQSIRQDHFLHPIVIDPNGTIRSRNSLPKEHEYSTFLLDETNKIMALGNPILFEKIGNLYSEILGNNIDHDKRDVPIIPSKKRVSLGIISDMEDVTVNVNLKNTTDSILTISDVNYSCPCVSAIVKHKTIRPKAESEIILKFKPSVDLYTENKYFSRFVYIYTFGNDTPAIIELYAYNNLIQNR